MSNVLRSLPAVHTVLNDPRLREIVPKHIADSTITKWVQEELSHLRQQILQPSFQEKASKEDFLTLIIEHMKEKIELKNDVSLKRVINATGIVLHTNFGRARLSTEAIEHIVQAAKNYTNLEYDIHSGKRGSRHDLLEKLICEVLGSEAAIVVNNNAAAVYFVLKAFAKQKEVIISRGELVEIGGSFRVSSIMEESGARLVEIGTTNKSHIVDYEKAITENTAILMKVHTSNFKIIGFTKSVPTEQLVRLAKSHDHILVYEDLGSGAFYPFRAAGIGEEPLVSEVLSSGVDLVTFSGDKLLGGPQAGIIAGKKKYIDRLKKHQLARVLRVDKLTLAGLEATIKAYQNKVKAKQLPVVRDILKTEEELLGLLKRMVEKLDSRNITYSIEKDFSMVGGGTMPGVQLPTYVLKLSHEKVSANEMAQRLRNQPIPIIVRIKDDHCLIDPRTVAEEEEEVIIRTLNKW